MTPEQALQLIATYAQLLPVPLADHQKCQTALAFLDQYLRENAAQKTIPPVEPEKGK